MFKLINKRILYGSDYTMKKLLKQSLWERIKNKCNGDTAMNIVGMSMFIGCLVALGFGYWIPIVVYISLPVIFLAVYHIWLNYL